MDDFQQIELKQTPEMTTVQFTCPDGEWLLSYLLSMADCTEVLAPADLREKMRQRINVLAELYNNKETKDVYKRQVQQNGRSKAWFLTTLIRKQFCGLKTQHRIRWN